MALFSTTAAIKNLTKLNSKRAEPPKMGYEYQDFDAYRKAGGTSTSLDSWKGLDAKWLRADREKGHQRWKNAMIAIIKDPDNMQNRVMPFEQVADLYLYTQVLVKYRKHETQWLYGAYYLVSDLADAYDRGATLTMFEEITPLATQITLDNLKALLAALNIAIANYAITQFNRLLYGEYRNSPRTGFYAWKFDKQFIISEQNPTAFPVYSDGQYALGILLEDAIFNKKGLFAGLNLGIDIVYIPVYPDQYNSNLLVNTPQNPRYGQDARIQVPLAMLYPNQYFYNDDKADDTETGQSAISISFKDTVFGQTLKRGASKALSNKSSGDKDVKIYLDYFLHNSYIKRVLKQAIYKYK